MPFASKQVEMYLRETAHSIAADSAASHRASLVITLITEEEILLIISLKVVGADSCDITAVDSSTQAR